MEGMKMDAARVILLLLLVIVVRASGKVNCPPLKRNCNTQPWLVTGSYYDRAADWIIKDLHGVTPTYPRRDYRNFFLIGDAELWGHATCSMFISKDTCDSCIRDAGWSIRKHCGRTMDGQADNAHCMVRLAAYPV